MAWVEAREAEGLRVVLHSGEGEPAWTAACVGVRSSADFRTSCCFASILNTLGSWRFFTGPQVVEVAGDRLVLRARPCPRAPSGRVALGTACPIAGGEGPRGIPGGGCVGRPEFWWGIEKFPLFSTISSAKALLSWTSRESTGETLGFANHIGI